MISRLRSAHGRWWIALAIVIPLLLWLALTARETIPRVEELPVTVEAAP